MKGNIARMRFLTLAFVSVLAAVVFDSCRIEPPLHLADSRDVEILLPEHVTDIEVIWGDSVNMDEWWYGWDDLDVKAFGSLDYPEPRSYEVRLYYLGDHPDADWLTFNSMSIDGNRFRNSYYFGYHDLLTWSNIYSPDHTQVVLIDETDKNDIKATTTETRLRFAAVSRESFKVFNGPEIFYSGLMKNLFVSKDPADYDYYDPVRNVWVKHLKMEVSPMVYTYLVQVVIYNNNGRVTGVNEKTAVSSLARGVSLHTGNTSETDALVCFDMRMKNGLNARAGRKADILGGKLTTFGLCGMEPWIRSRAESHYTGSRGDLLNKLMLNLQFNSERDSVYTYDITPQMRRQAHGGVITIEIDADTLAMPVSPPKGPSEGFDPTINGYDDEITHEFEM